MPEYKKPTEYFDETLAEMLAGKLRDVQPEFDGNTFTAGVGRSIQNKSLKQRVELLADRLHQHLPDHFPTATDILVRILGPENPEETGMFTHFYWVMPIAKFVEKYGLNHFDESIRAIEEITKRNTGEYAIRPFIRRYPDKTLRIMRKWTQSENFHLRRLASEGLRPKLPWATKLDVFVDEPAPVFDILTVLKDDPVRFVQKSVANHITDYFKVNPDAAKKLVRSWQPADSVHTQWIIKSATRNIKLDG